MSKFIEIPEGWEVDQDKLKICILKLIVNPIVEPTTISKTFSVGSKFREQDKGTIYTLICTENCYCLVDTETGGNWSDSIRRESKGRRITEKQLDLLNGGDCWKDDFSLISDSYEL